MKSLRHYLSIVLTVFAFTGCAAIGGTGDIFSMIGGTTSTPTGSGATDTSTTDAATTGEDAAGTTGGSELMPTIPVASGDSFLISDTNSSSSSQLLGTGLDASYSLLVSTAGSRNESPSLGYAHLISQTLQPLHFVYDYYKLKTGQLSAGQFFARYINPSQPGALLWSQFIPPAFASSTTCSGTIVPISADGTVSYELPNVAAGMSYSIQYVNTAAAAAGDCSAVGEPVYESPVSAVQFVAGDTASSNSIAFDGTDSACSIVTDASSATNIMQEIAYTTDTGFEVAATTAEHTTCAVDAALVADATSIDYNESHAHLLVQDGTGISDGSFFSSRCIGDCAPTRMKAKGAREYFATNHGTTGSRHGSLIDFETPGSSENDIRFYVDPDVLYPTFKQTLAYDVDDSQTALVVFETVAGATYFSTKSIHDSFDTDGLSSDVTAASDPTTLNFDGEIKDIWSYGDFPAAAAGRDTYDGKAVMLTTTHLYQMTYDALGVVTTTTVGADPCAGMDAEEAAETEGCGATTSTSTAGDGKSVTIASSLALAHTASAMVISDAKDAVYILNTDSSVTIVDPVTLTATPGPVAYDSDVDGTITADEMKAALGYDFAYDLTSIKYVTTDDGAGGSVHYLLLGANGLDSVLTIAIE